MVLVQTRLAARNGIGLDTVLRRYFAGYTLIVDFLAEESERGVRMRRSEVRRLVRAQAGVFDQLVNAVGEEYGREMQMCAQSTEPDTTERRRIDCVERLLAGELSESPSVLNYDFP